MLTRTVWFVVPIFWIPIALYLFFRSVFQFAGPIQPFMVDPVLPMRTAVDVPPDAYVKAWLCFFTGNVIWTILEYGLHRFLFHVDDWLPDRPLFFTLHFLLHGVHHYLPMDRCVTLCNSTRRFLIVFNDRLRLVMPPALFGALQLPFTRLAYVLFPTPVANGIISGAFFFC
jgi:4-hydroxysphinganine ceramide fatty acyl 2-hydroxylase